MQALKTEQLYDLSHTLASELLGSCEYPWLALPHIREWVCQIGETLPEERYTRTAEDIWVAKSARIAANVTLCGPAIIGENTEVRTGAYIRGAVIIGNGCVVGNSCELKNAILFDSVQTPHFNYIGDSILGYHSHTGAGAVTSNVKSDKTPVTIKTGTDVITTGLKKMGAMIGDFVEVGCNCVLNPGTVIGRNTNIYPLSSVRGFVPPDSIFKSSDNIVPKKPQ